ncbi:hypothetical protein ACLQ29_27935 [Micromonospora sp. DT228]|uniref:hypothetical protein n=1 Tax=Micromonospora sp. DT228 TaxID=3393443 RepID=UPI003CF88A13
MEIVEQFVRGKYGDPDVCEDAIVVTAEHVAVIDGATDVSGRRYGNGAGGWWAMAACRDAVRRLPRGVDSHSAVAAMTAELAARIDSTLSAAERPSAAVTVYSRARREIWQVGDVGFAYRGLPTSVGQPRKLVDQVAASFRAAVLAAEVAAGAISMDRLVEVDPGQLAARALTGRQGGLRNSTGPYAYAAIDGRPVPPSLVVVHPVPGDVDELVIASDGYPVIGETLAESESTLALLLEKDPWCVAELAGTKGVLPGQVSFDDRAYLRVRGLGRR